jgi:hypothetical protein
MSCSATKGLEISFAMRMTTRELVRYMLLSSMGHAHRTMASTSCKLWVTRSNIIVQLVKFSGNVLDVSNRNI